MKPMKSIAYIPISECPLCGKQSLTVSVGEKKLLFGKKPDTVVCPNCNAVFHLSQDSTHIRYKVLPSPFAFFSDYFSDWILPNDAAKLARYIDTNSKLALSYLPGAKRYAWALRIILGASGSAGADSIQFDFSWNGKPESKDEARRELANIRQIQKEIRQIKREMNQEMKEIRARYGRRKDTQAAKAAALRPYESVIISADNILVQLDRAKLDIQAWVDEHL